MVDYLKRVITEFPEVISGGATSPAADRLFTVRPEEESKPLEEKRAIAFHHCVAQLLFASARARKDIQPSGCLHQRYNTGRYVSPLCYGLSTM
jgi:hypothetical protein